MDVVTYGADAKQFFDVHAQMQRAAARTSSTVGDTRGYDNLFQSENRLHRSTRLLAASLLEARDAGQAVGGSLEGLIMSLRTPLAVAIGGIAFAEGAKLVLKQLEEIDKAFVALQRDLGHPLALTIDLSPADIAARITQLKTETDALIKSRNTLGGFLIHGFSRGRDDISEAVTAGQQRQAQLADAQANAEQKIVDLKVIGRYEGEEAAAAAKAELDYDTARAKLFEGAFKPGADQSVLFKRLASLREERDLTKEIAQETADSKSEEIFAETQIAEFRGQDVDRQKLALDLALRHANYEKEIADAVGNKNRIETANLNVAKAELDIEKNRIALLQREVGAMKQIESARHNLLLDAAEEHLKSPADQYADLQKANELYSQLRSEANRLGVPFDAQRPRYGEAYHPFEPDQATKAADIQQATKSLMQLAGADFSSLAALGHADFSGLQSLNGLKITIK